MPTEAQAPLQELFKALNDLRGSPGQPDAVNHTLGLNQDEKLQQAEQIAYRNSLANALIPRVAKRLEDRLRNALNQDMELAYESLKAYVMIHTPKAL